MRLEIESKKDRDYQWVVHHVERPSSVEFEERKYREVAPRSRLQEQPGPRPVQMHPALRAE